MVLCFAMHESFIRVSELELSYLQSTISNAGLLVGAWARAWVLLGGVVVPEGLPSQSEPQLWAAESQDFD